MSGFNPKWIVGKTIRRVEMQPFPAEPNVSRRMAHNPVITFTDGSSIGFVVEETEVGEYGVDITYRAGAPK